MIKPSKNRHLPFVSLAFFVSVKYSFKILSHLIPVLNMGWDRDKTDISVLFGAP